MGAVLTKAAAAIAKLILLKRDEDDRSTRNLVIFLAALIVILLMLQYTTVYLFVTPYDELQESFSPATITSAKLVLGSYYTLPVKYTYKKGLLPFPVTSQEISSYYGDRYIPGKPHLSYHEGLDFPVAFGTDVMAIAPGTIVDTGVNKDYGSHILIKHQMYRYDEFEQLIEIETFYSFYAHLSRIYVFEGQVVKQRQQIAASGGDPEKHFAGNTTGAHLHLELRSSPVSGTHFDPEDYLLDTRPFSGETKSIGWG